MLIDYNPILLAVILRVAPRILQSVKDAIVEATLKLETDDRAYLYIPGDYKVLVRRGHFIAKVSNYIPIDDLIIEMAIKQTAHILAHEDKDTIKYIFIIVDNYKPSVEKYGITKGFAIEQSVDTNAQFVICDLGRNESLQDLCSHHPRCRYLNINNVSDLGREMINVYYPEEDRTVIDKEFQEKYGKTPAQARQELKEKYSTTHSIEEQYAQDVPVKADPTFRCGIKTEED